MLKNIRGGKIGIVNGIARRIGSAPFGDVNGEVWPGRVVNQSALAVGDVGGRMNIIAEIQQTVPVLIQSGRPVAKAICVVADEVERQRVGGAISNMVSHPCRPGAGWSAHAVSGVDFLDGEGGVGVKLEIFLLGSIRITRAPEAGVVGFVPDFEIPFFDLIFAVQ